MSIGEQDEVSWLAVDEAVRIEIRAAELAAMGDLTLLFGTEGGPSWGELCGWDGHQFGVEIHTDRPDWLAGWLARQIWCHGRGDDSEHVEYRKCKPLAKWPHRSRNGR